MVLEADEQKNVTPVGYSELNGRPGFKIAMQEVDGRWYVYLAHFWHRGWSIVDVTDPTDPELVRFVEGPDNTTTKQIQVADGKMITALERPGTTDPAHGESTDPSKPYETGAYIWDVETDPTDPELLGHYETGGRGTHRNFYNGGDYAFMCVSPEGFEPTLEDRTIDPVKNFHLRIIDISDPSEPTEISTFMWPGQHPEDDSEKPRTRYFHGPAYAMDDRAYLSYGRVGMVTLDISDIENPELVTNLGLGEGLGGYNGVHSYIPIPGTDLAAINSEAIHEGYPLDHESGDPLGYTFLVDISDEDQPHFEGTTHHGPRVVSSMPNPIPEPDAPYDSYFDKPGRFGPHNQHHPRGEDCRLHQSNYLVMTYFNAGVRIFDISDPAVPQEAGYFVPSDPEKRYGPRPRNELGSQVEDVAIDSRGYIYCTDPNRGLMIFESDLF
ncbi:MULTISPECIES: LVIVD repeat-containing protein [Haloferacaceae]|uniref:LVIVD repeat-containing protein n=1 Tax=Halorubrum glutamatedens TaxID=2707018 RepID=A0ABD5QMZ4_9EURY|nr:hypothetical protein [Halobellus captivus]